MKTLIDLEFKGELPAVNLAFLKNLFDEKGDIYFVQPDVSGFETYNDVVQIINSNSYIDLVISTNSFHVFDLVIPNVFVNLGRNEHQIDLLYFFDLSDVGNLVGLDRLRYLREWATAFKNEFGFNYFICQDDYGLYFDTNKEGPLFR